MDQYRLRIVPPSSRWPLESPAALPVWFHFENRPLPPANLPRTVRFEIALQRPPQLPQVFLSW
jgi:hypothetical protein